MSKFKVGDMVVRTKGEHRGMQVGDTGTIGRIKDLHRVYLKEWSMKKEGEYKIGSHNPDNLELISGFSYTLQLVINKEVKKLGGIHGT